MIEIVTILKNNNVILDNGLTEKEIEQLERKYKIKFPDELKELYKKALPISKGFYNWREALNDENKDKFEAILNKPFLELRKQVDEIEWNDMWGEKPDNSKEIILSKINDAPKLIPVFKHRYMYSTSDGGFPVISVFGWDCIVYGNNLKNYFKLEYKQLNWNDMDFKHIKQIPFWSEIM